MGNRSQNESNIHFILTVFCNVWVHPHNHHTSHDASADTNFLPAQFSCCDHSLLSTQTPYPSLGSFLTPGLLITLFTEIGLTESLLLHCHQHQVSKTQVTKTNILKNPNECHLDSFSIYFCTCTAASFCTLVCPFPGKHSPFVAGSLPSF